MSADGRLLSIRVFFYVSLAGTFRSNVGFLVVVHYVNPQIVIHAATVVSLRVLLREVAMLASARGVSSFGERKLNSKQGEVPFILV